MGREGKMAGFEEQGGDWNGEGAEARSGAGSKGGRAISTRTRPARGRRWPWRENRRQAQKRGQRRAGWPTDEVKSCHGNG